MMMIFFMALVVSASLGVNVKPSELPPLQSFVTALGCNLPECRAVLTSNVCPLQYITCAADGSVTRISLFNVGLTGSLTSSLGQLTSLTALSIARNSALKSTFVSEIGRLTKLVSLELNDQPGLVGSVPSELLLLTSLASLNVRGCRLSGRLPQLQYLPSLVTCILGYAFDPAQNCFAAPCPAVCQCLDAEEPLCTPLVTPRPTPVPTPRPTPFPTPMPTPTTASSSVATTTSATATTSTTNTLSGATSSITSQATTPVVVPCFGELRPGVCANNCPPPATAFFRDGGATDGTCGTAACCVPPAANCTTRDGEAGACLSRAECALHGGEPSPLEQCAVTNFMIQCCVNRTMIPTFAPETTSTAAPESATSVVVGPPMSASAALLTAPCALLLLAIGLEFSCHE
jgi:hypothetical protein